MTVTIVIRNLPLRAALRRRLEALSDDLAEYFRLVQKVEWDLDAEHRAVVARCRVHARSGYYRASSRASSAIEALDSTFAKIVKQRRRLKRRRLSKRRDRVD